MLTFIKHYLRRYPKIKKAYNSLQWEKSIYGLIGLMHTYPKKPFSLIRHSALR